MSEKLQECRENKDNTSNLLVKWYIEARSNIPPWAGKWKSQHKPSWEDPRTRGSNVCKVWFDATAVEELKEENDKLRALEAWLRRHINKVYDLNITFIPQRDVLQERNRQIIEGRVRHDYHDGNPSERMQELQLRWMQNRRRRTGNISRILRAGVGA